MKKPSRQDIQVSDAEVLFFYLLRHPMAWASLVGMHVESLKHGSGIICNVDGLERAKSLEDLTVRASFGSPIGEREFVPEALFNRKLFKIHGIGLPEATKASLREQITTNRLRRLMDDYYLSVAEGERELRLKRQLEERRRQADAADAFKELMSMYWVREADIPRAETFRLGEVLLKLDGNELLSQSDLTWLEDRKLWGPLAVYHERAFRLNEDPWELTKASAEYRKIGQPHLALRSLSQIEGRSFSPDVVSALLTTKGGALRDLEELAAAEACARRAIGIDTDAPHAHNLLGAIFLQQGKPTEGWRECRLAQELGTDPTSQAFHIRDAVRRAEPQNAKRVARFLFERDPGRYAWARKYL